MRVIYWQIRQLVGLTQFISIIRLALEVINNLIVSKLSAHNSIVNFRQSVIQLIFS